MGAIIRTRLFRTVSAFGVEAFGVGVWSLIDPTFVATHAWWFIGLGFASLVAVWFAEQILEFVNYKRGLAPKASPIDFSYGIHADSSGVVDREGNVLDGITAITFCLIVANDSGDGRTLRNLRATTRLTASDVANLGIRGTLSPTTDLQHGDLATFEIGNVFVAEDQSKTMPRGGGAKVKAEHPDVAAHNARHGHLTLWVIDYLEQTKFGCGGVLPKDPPLSSPPQSRPFILPIVVTADEVMGQTALVEVDLYSPNQWEWLRLKAND